MTDLTTGELADELGLTFTAFEARNKRVGQFEANQALANFVSAELEKVARLKALEKAAGMGNGESRVGTES